MASQFGRYSDINKSEKNLKEWEQAVDDFEKGNFLSGFKHLLGYIQNEQVQTVYFSEVENTIHFEIYHCYHRIFGTFHPEKISVMLCIADLNQKPLPLLRKILASNYDLNYSRFAILEEKLFLLSNASKNQYNPYLLYNILQEVCLKGNSIFNKILSDISYGDNLQGVQLQKNLKVTSFYTDEEINVRKKWIQNTLQKALDRSKEVSAKGVSGGASYLLLSVIFKIDYFLQPVGALQVELESIHRLFFADDGLSTEAKNKKMTESIQFLLTKYDKYAEDLVKTNYSFSFTVGSTIPIFIDQIQKSLNGYVWYQENQYPDIALECLLYGVLYCTFNYKLPKILEELFEVYLTTSCASSIKEFYHGELWYAEEPKFIQKGKILGLFGKEIKSQFHQVAIKEKITEIEAKNKEVYPSFHFQVSALQFDSLFSFCLSFLKELPKCDFQTFK